MNEDAPITWLINQIEALIGGMAATGAAALAGKVAPIIGVCFGIYMILIALNYIRGAEDNFVGDLMYRSLAFTIIISMCVNANSYVNTIMPIVRDLGTDLASAVSGAPPGSNALDSLAKKYLDLIANGFAEIGLITGTINPFKIIELIFEAIILVVTITPFLVAASLMLILAKVGLLIMAIVGPIFMGALLFPATRQYFSSWLNAVLSYSFIPLIVAVISLLSVSITDSLLPSGEALAKISIHRVFLIGLCNLILCYLIKQVSAMASSLSAGGINAGGGGGIGAGVAGVNSAFKAGKNALTNAKAIKAALTPTKKQGGDIKAG